MDPGDAPGSGQVEVPITNWAGVFIEGIEGTVVRLRITGHAGLDPVAGGSGGSSGALSKVVRLIR